MTYDAFFEKCETIFKLNQISIQSEKVIPKLFELTEIMLKVNEQMNLTTITDQEQIILKHYADSLSILPYIPKFAKIIDVGCGAGFPSLPLAIAREDIEIVSLDSTEKRIKYVQSTASSLGLNNLTAITARAENYAKEEGVRESFDIAVARAVADLPVLCELCIPFVRIGGSFIAMKASKGDDEFSRSQDAIRLCGCDNAQIIQADLTQNGTAFEKRRIILAQKVAPTPKNFPRNFSQISKKPL